MCAKTQYDGVRAMSEKIKKNKFGQCQSQTPLSSAFWVQKDIGSKKILGLNKTFGSKNFFESKQNFWFKNNFWSKKY